MGLPFAELPRGKGRGRQGDSDYAGATPSYVIWNLLQRYTREKWLVVDPMAGSGTTLDVARDLNRRALAYDVEPTREDVFRADARKLPLETGKADFVFVDPPYSAHVKYSGRPECIGELDARRGHAYYEAMEKVILEIHRVLKPERHMALYVSDSAKKGSPLEPIGFKLFAMLSQLFLCEDIVAVVRHNKSLKRQNWHDAAAQGNFFLRGFNYLFIMYKPKPAEEDLGPVGARRAEERSVVDDRRRRPRPAPGPDTVRHGVRRGAVPAATEPRFPERHHGRPEVGTPVAGDGGRVPGSSTSHCR